jgi:outer membrane murein-binding lipoprotein Lpp
MKRLIGATALAVLFLAGCGSTAATTATSKATSDRASAAAALVQRTGAKQFYAPGRPAVTAAQCHGSGSTYSCLLTYQETAPNGQRHELQMSVPVNCSGQCRASWATAGTGKIIRNLGLDPRSPVARCEKALSASIQTFTSPAADATTAIVCKHVHHGVYSP